MTYSQWADEYKQSADMLKEKIAVLKAQLLTAPVEQIRELNFRISTMYGMYLDCMDTAKNLRKRKGAAF